MSRTGRSATSTRGTVPVRPLAGRIVVVALITAICWAIGLDLGNALTIALVVIVLYGLRSLLGGEDEAWLPPPESAHNEGTRREVARLSWGMQGQDDRVDRWSAQRLHALAARRTAEHGLDLDSPGDEAGCRALLGRATYDALSLDPNRLPRYPQFVDALEVVERLTPEEIAR